VETLDSRVTTLAQSFRDKIGAVDAVRSAAPVVIAELARYTKMSELIDKMFAGMPRRRPERPGAGFSAKCDFANKDG